MQIRLSKPKKKNYLLKVTPKKSVFWEEVKDGLKGAKGVKIGQDSGQRVGRRVDGKSFGWKAEAAAAVKAAGGRQTIAGR